MTDQIIFFCLQKGRGAFRLYRSKLKGVSAIVTPVVTILYELRQELNIDSQSLFSSNRGMTGKSYLLRHFIWGDNWVRLVQCVKAALNAVTKEWKPNEET